ncbi:MAG: hypothetical protein JO149_05780 [Gammaproteobacteria bacterium]|nr:hypothetical protein [Gammaproteobacteria bacterium]
MFFHQKQFYTDNKNKHERDEQIEKESCNQAVDKTISLLKGKKDSVSKQLLDYLVTRKSERQHHIQTPSCLFFDDNAQLESRALFINKLIKADDTTKLQLLSERNIKQFKGIFTQRLYDILIAYRNNLEPKVQTLYCSL